MWVLHENLVKAIEAAPDAPLAELLAVAIEATRLQEWEDYYNYDRPHGGLDGQTPYERLKQKTTDPKVNGLRHTYSSGVALLIVLTGRYRATDSGTPAGNVPGQRSASRV